MVLKFLQSTFGPLAFKDNGEVQFKCPYCSHPNFYFNTRKGIGHCHRASCQKSPTLKDLTTLAGASPLKIARDPLGTGQVRKSSAEPLVHLPDWWPVLEPGKPSKSPDALEAILHRGIPVHAVSGWGLKYDGRRVYIPVYQDQKLVQYVGRLRWWGDPIEGQRYRYATGVNISQFLLGWEEAKLWTELMLVENSFNAIAYRSALQLPCSTNFGSHLSGDQINLILGSPIRRVVIVWDENAEKAADRAVRNLRKAGVNAISARISGQPDSHSPDYIKSLYRASCEASEKGLLAIDGKQVPEV